MPQRSNLLRLENYARFQSGNRELLAGHTEASRGCRHLCLHCPIPPVYGGRFFVVPVETVLKDVRQLVAWGARHISFGDPDFLNGPGHSLKIARAFHREFPELTFDFTAKVEHLVAHRDLLREFARSGCVFVVSAVESLNDAVLANLCKGHSRADVEEALSLVRDAGIIFRPTWVPFTPWATLNDYLEMLEFVCDEDLIDCVDPVQYAIRLLVPPGSRLLGNERIKPYLGPLVLQQFTYHWTHPDSRMDALQRQVAVLVENATGNQEDPWITFFRIRELALSTQDERDPVQVEIKVPADRKLAPRLTEHWFC